MASFFDTLFTIENHRVSAMRESEKVKDDSAVNAESEIELPINSHVYFSVATNEPSSNVIEQQEQQVEQIEQQLPKSPSLAYCAPRETKWSLIKKKIIDNFLPLGFAFALIVALSYPAPGRQLASYSFMGVFIAQAINNVNVFFISGITLNVNAMAEIRMQWKAASFGLLTILVLTPLLGFLFVNVPLEPKEFSVGLAIFCCVPTTLGVGVALTTAAGGNASLSLFLTVVSNIIGILTMPYLLQLVLTGTDMLKFNPVNVFIKLIFTVLVPSVAGALVRRFPVVRDLVALRRTELSMFSTLNLVCIIWQTLSSSSSILLQQSAATLILVIAISALLHIFLLIVLFFLTSPRGPMGLPIKERVSITIMCAQKSAPVAITLISYITSTPATQGLLTIPALIGQLCQIFIGSALIARFCKMIKTEQEGAGASTSSPGSSGSARMK